jgi:VIT1/CCC1 family predicted Fe2+/Mn2+ transporter
MNTIAGGALAAARRKVSPLDAPVAHAGSACSLTVSQYIAEQTLGERCERVARELRGFDALDAPARSAILQKELVGRGISNSSARAIGAALVADASKSSAALGLLRYGFNAGEHGSPLCSAFVTLLASAAGALIPILPWYVVRGKAAIVASVSLSSAAAVIVGALIGSRTRE